MNDLSGAHESLFYHMQQFLICDLNIASVFKLLSKICSKVHFTEFILSGSPQFEMQFMYPIESGV